MGVIFLLLPIGVKVEVKLGYQSCRIKDNLKSVFDVLSCIPFSRSSWAKINVHKLQARVHKAYTGRQKFHTPPHNEIAISCKGEQGFTAINGGLGGRYFKKRWNGL